MEGPLPEDSLSSWPLSGLSPAAEGEERRPRILCSKKKYWKINS